MTTSAAQAPGEPRPTLSIGVTGHRANHPSWPSDTSALKAVTEEIFGIIEAAGAESEAEIGSRVGHRQVGLLADGADQLMAEAATARGWSLMAPLPFGRRLTTALACQPMPAEDYDAILSGKPPASAEVAARTDSLAGWLDRAHLFELADADRMLIDLFALARNQPRESDAAQAFAERASQRYALAGAVMIDHSDFLIAVWDGHHLARIGGTGHTIARALEHGGAVVRIDPTKPGDWHVLQVPEDLVATPRCEGREDVLFGLVKQAICRAGGEDWRQGNDSLAAEAWPERSSRLTSSYRRIETLFGNEGRQRFGSLVQVYEKPDAIAEGSGKPLVRAIAALPGMPADFVSRIDRFVLRRFAWADGISANLSDSYRGGMVLSFLLSAFAIIAGIAYQPIASDGQKWIFALAEFVMLIAILAITAIGVNRRWHSRWFETRRLAEYLRQAPILLAMGVARPPGRWPKGINTSWPEAYALASLREAGVPDLVVAGPYLRAALATIIDPHVRAQRDYHRAKAARLGRVHHVLDSISERLFIAAVFSVALYLALKGLSLTGTVPASWPASTSKIFTFLGVSLPTLGAALAGLRYFGDFERFAAISQVTAEKLDNLHDRLRILLGIDDDRLGFAEVAEVVREMDEIVVSEIENWQAVFGGKQITVPA